MSTPMLDNLLELVGQIEQRLARLESQPPAGTWARSVEYLVDKYVTTRNVRNAALTLAGIWVAVFGILNGIPGT